MRVWIDVTNSPHVVFFRPLRELLLQRGADVLVTARDYAQTLGLLARSDIPYDLVGPPHAGGSAVRKAAAMTGRLRELRRWAREYGIDVALAHASHELPLTARSLGIPSAYAFDYEFASVQHGLGSRAATRVIVPEAIPQSRLQRLGARSKKVRRYAGLKEEYYLSSFEPDPAVPAGLGVDPARVLVVLRPPPDVSLYHRDANPLFQEVLYRVGADPAVHAVLLPRTVEQRWSAEALDLPSLLVPDYTVDAQSLVALADLVVSAGGTMNREAVALGTPVYTTFAGRLGAVDEALVAEGRLRRLTSARVLVLQKRTGERPRTPRDPGVMLDLLLSALG